MPKYAYRGTASVDYRHLWTIFFLTYFIYSGTWIHFQFFLGVSKNVLLVHLYDHFFLVKTLPFSTYMTIFEWNMIYFLSNMRKLIETQIFCRHRLTFCPKTSFFNFLMWWIIRKLSYFGLWSLSGLQIIAPQILIKRKTI